MRKNSYEKDKYLNEVILVIGVLILLFFSYYLPIWQFLSYNIHCEKLTDTCKITESISHITVKTFKISDVSELVNKEIVIPSGKGSTTPHIEYYVSLKKKDGSYTFVRGLLANNADEDIAKNFNDFLKNDDERQLDYKNGNEDFKAVALVWLILILVLAFVVELKYKNSLDFSLPTKKEFFTPLNIIIIGTYTLLLISSTISVFTSLITNTDSKDFYKKDIEACLWHDELKTKSKLSILFDGKNELVFEDITTNITDSKMKELYKIDYEFYFQNKYHKIISETDNSLIIKKDYEKCNEDIIFYGENDCLNENECYIEKRFIVPKHPDVSSEVRRYDFIKIPDESLDYMITFKITKKQIPQTP